jgi:hypothetical protein
MAGVAQQPQADVRNLTRVQSFFWSPSPCAFSESAHLRRRVAGAGVLPGPAKDTSLATQLSRNIQLNLPLVSAAMDTVTEARLRSPSPRKAASASSTRTSRRSSRPPKSPG